MLPDCDLTGPHPQWHIPFSRSASKQITELFGSLLFQIAFAIRHLPTMGSSSEPPRTVTLERVQSAVCSINWVESTTVLGWRILRLGWLAFWRVEAPTAWQRREN